MNNITLVECPRDAMQGLPNFVPTGKKIEYLNLLLQVGFDVLDFGSFVSPKAVPQMADTAEVLAELTEDTQTALLAIVANDRGAEAALKHARIQYLGYPFSISETFQQRNTRRSIAESLPLVEAMQARCVEADRQLVVYLSMGFGNPYDEPWSPELLEDYAGQMYERGVRILSLADTVGSASPQDIQPVFERLTRRFPDVAFGAHFHSHPTLWQEKIEAAWAGGCRRFDGALQGWGGCPFATDELTGNIATENLISFMEEKNVALEIHREMLPRAFALASEIFNEIGPNGHA